MSIILIFSSIIAKKNHQKPLKTINKMNAVNLIFLLHSISKLTRLTSPEETNHNIKEHKVLLMMTVSV